MHTVPVATLCVLIVGFATIFSTVGKGRSFETRVLAKIPFAFQVGGYRLPPGIYSLRTAGDFLWIKGHSDSVVMVINREPSRGPSSSSAVVFHRYGENYFLREVRSAGDDTLLWTGETKAERRAKREEDALYPNSVRREEAKVEVSLLASAR